MKNKYYGIISLCCLLTLCLTATAYSKGPKGNHSTGGFMGPGQEIGSVAVTKTGQIQATLAASAKSFVHDTPVILVGNIIRSVGQDLYTFRDSSGEIAVRIKQGDWKGLSIEEYDGIVIAGYVKHKGYGQIEVDVRVLSRATSN